ncbi:HEPN domain-containing protein [Nocardia australiensis]|uniref:HEPN domain-containing protein n=1 Tax=Nocardia australiensis TaxID=2887191 RepID=UPI001D13E076|nr:HEPN domain-containing protein [Nocardia australiensis]
MADDSAGKTTTWPLEGGFACGSGFLVTPDCLGQRFRSRTANHELSLTLPVRTDGTEENGLRRAPWTYVLEGDERDACWSDDEWGSVAGAAAETPTYAHIKRCVVHSEVASNDGDEFKAAAQRFGDELAVWWSSVCDWLDILTLQDFASLKRTQRSILNDSVQMWSGDSAGIRKAGISYQVFTGGIHQVEVLDAHQLQAALDLAARGTQPDAEWLFMRDARSLLNAGEYRRAVIDACTAAELAVTSLIDRKFDDDGISKAERKREFDSHHGLSKLTQLHKKRRASGKLPKRVVEEVGAPRNKAAHKGACLSRAEADTAIGTAAEVVSTAFPLSSIVPGFPASIIRSSRQLGLLPQDEDLHLARGCDFVARAELPSAAGMNGQSAIMITGRTVRHDDTPPQSSS